MRVNKPSVPRMGSQKEKYQGMGATPPVTREQQERVHKEVMHNAQTIIHNVHEALKLRAQEKREAVTKKGEEERTLPRENKSWTQEEVDAYLALSTEIKRNFK